MELNGEIVRLGLERRVGLGPAHGEELRRIRVPPVLHRQEVPGAVPSRSRSLQHKIREFHLQSIQSTLLITRHNAVYLNCIRLKYCEA